MAKLSSPKPKISSNDRMIRLIIGTVFVVMFAFRFSGTAFSAMFSCFMGCNDRSPMFERFALVDGCFLLIAIITAIALYKKASWSVAVGLVLGLSYFITIVLSLVAFERTLGQILLFLFLPYNILVYIAIGLLFRLTSQNPFPKNFSSISIISCLSFLCAVLLVSQFASDEKLAPSLKADQQEEESKMRGSVASGVTYADQDLGLEITFPDKRNIREDFNDTTSGVSKTFFADTVLNHTTFTIEAADESKTWGPNNSTSIEGILRIKKLTDPAAILSVITINDMPFVKIDHSYDSQSIFMTCHNNLIYTFFGNNQVSSSESMNLLHTVKFTDNQK